MWIAVGVVSALVAAFAVRAHMHMYQLNSYSSSTHARWLGKHRAWWVSQLAVLLVSFLSLVWPLVSAVVIFVLLALGFLFYRPKRRHEKKPLVCTARVIRMFVTAAVLAGAVLVAALFVPASWRIIVSCLPYALSPVWCLVVNGLNSPVERAVKRHYINDARRILASHRNLITIGVTGSFGKTSVKYYLATLLRGRFNVLMTPESYNTPMGITMTVRGQLRATHEIFVCEMGAKRKGEIKADCDIVNPTIAVITAIGEQHLETFGSQEAIIQTKFELADAVRGKGVLYLNGDDGILRTRNVDQEKHLYGLRTDNGTYAYDIRIDTSGSTFCLSHRGEVVEGIRTPLIGEHTIQNLAGAMAVALDLGVTPDELRTQSKKLTPAPHRLAMSKRSGVTIIDDAYNSNPAGAKAALDTLGLFDAMKVLITPGMVELGPRQDALNEEFGAQAVIADHVFLVGSKQTEPIARGLRAAGYDESKLTVVEDVQEAILRAHALPCRGDKVILLENDLPDNY